MSFGVDDHSLVQARAVVIATGARPSVPAALAEACGERSLTHETVFDLAELPASLAVIGAGPLGIELAIAFARLGARVAIFDEGRVVGAIADPVVQAAVQAELARELGIHLDVGVEARHIGKGDVRVSWRTGEGPTSSASFQYVLSAAGRPPAVDGLDLQMTGLDLDDRGVPTFAPPTQRCAKSAIFIAGDADNRRPALHEAAARGELAGANAARLPKNDRSPPCVALAIVFTDPDMAIVGDGFDPKREKDWAIGCSDDNGRARVDGRRPGLLRIYVRREDRVVVGGEMFGPDVEHLAQMLAWVAQLEMTVHAALALPFYHPRIQESLRAALRDAKAKL